MIITEQPITTDNVFEQIALIAKKKLIAQGVLPDDANKLAIEFVKGHGEQIVKNTVEKINYDKKSM
jgi:hypothetical protein